MIAGDSGICIWDPGPPGECETFLGCVVDLYATVKGLYSHGLNQAINWHRAIEVSGTNSEQTEVETVGLLNRQKAMHAFAECPCKPEGEEAKTCEVVIKAGQSQIGAKFKCQECQAVENQ